MNQDSTKLNELDKRLEGVITELRGRGGVQDRLDDIETQTATLTNAYWKGIGIIAGLAAASGFIGTLVGYIFFK